jgi:Na+(H+)/acetate symporter ActP
MLKVLIFFLVAILVGKRVGESQDLVPYLWSQGRRIEAIGVAGITTGLVVAVVVCSFL